MKPKFLMGFIVAGIVFLVMPPPTASAYFTGMPASVVIGQPDFTSNSSGIAQDKLKTATRGIFVDPQGKLIVGDEFNHRVLIWNSIPTTNGAPADLVLGQANFTSGSANRGGSIAANTLNQPTGVYSDGNKLFVMDNSNDRVLIWNSFPTTNGQAADIAVGSSDLVSNPTDVCDAKTFSNPYGLWVYQGKLIVVDLAYNRVLIWNSIPTSNGTPANVVVGQQDLSTCSSLSLSSQSISDARSVMVDSKGKMFVADKGRQRVLIWNSVPATNFVSADVVVGQPDFTSSGGAVAANRLNSILSIFSNGDRLFIPDTSGGQRVLIYNSIPTSNGASADIVLGQQSFTTNTTNGPGGSVSANGFNGPQYVFEYNNKLLVLDDTNARILIFPNITNPPRLGISGIAGSPDTLTSGRLRINGNISVDGGLYNLWKVEASVNGGDYTGVSSGALNNSVIMGSTLNPGNNQTIASVFFHDFEPWNFQNQSEGGNGLKSDWITNQDSMLKSQGYTFKLRGTTNNADTGDSLFYFLPFTMLSPTNSTSNPFSVSLPQSPVSPQSPLTATTGILPVLSTNPSFSFKVNQYQRSELKLYLDHYEVWLKLNSEEQPWTKYIDHIPIDYDLVRDYEDNLNKGSYDGTKDTGNGTYRTNTLQATYSNNSSTISVKKLSNQEGTIPPEPFLSPGVYEVKITSVDKSQHTQDTENPVVVVVK